MISHSSIIKGYHGQLIKQSRITVRGRQSIHSKTLQGKPKHTERCPNKADTDHTVPIDPQFEIDITVPGTRLSGMPPFSTSSLEQVPPPGNEPGR
jgi:hypothetical protein